MAGNYITKITLHNKALPQLFKLFHNKQWQILNFSNPLGFRTTFAI